MHPAKQAEYNGKLLFILITIDYIAIIYLFPLGLSFIFLHIPTGRSAKKAQQTETLDSS